MPDRPGKARGPAITRPGPTRSTSRRQAAESSASTVQAAADVERDLEIARGLAREGIPIFVAYPDPKGETPSGKATGYALRGDWQHTTPNPAYVGAWKPGLALIAVMGCGLDAVDGDPRNGGDLATLDGIMPEVLGIAESPSGGEHKFVRSMGVRSRDGVLPGIDVKAGDAGGQGRGFVFIAPTVRPSKVTGELVAYRWARPPDLARLHVDDGSGEKLAQLVRQAHGSRRQTGASLPFTQPGERKHTGPIPYGQHHDQLVSYAGYLLGLGLPLQPEAETLMLRRLRDCVQPPGAGRPLYAEDEALAELHDVYDRYPAGDTAAEADSGQPAAQNSRRLVLTPASQIDPEPVVWAWEQFGQGRIPASSVGLFAGREGTGKSSFLIWVAAQVTRGELPGAFKGSPRAVIYVTFEDSWKYTIVPRLIAAGADLDLVYRAEVQATEGDTYSLSQPADNNLLEEAIAGNRVVLVVIDPLLSAISDVLDTHVNRQVRRALDPLRGLVDRTGAVIAGIAHFSKSSGTDASSLITGSGAFKDVARFIFAFAADDDGKVITQTKNSLGRSDLPSLAYRMIEAIVPTAKGDARVGQFVFDGEAARDVRDILGTRNSAQDQDEKTRAEDYLKKALADGPRRTKEVEEESRQAEGIAPRTLDRARKSLRIPAAKRADGWWISLPEHEGDLMGPPERETALPAKTANTANTALKGPLGGVGGLDLHCEQCGAPISPLRLAQAGQQCSRCEAAQR